MKNAKLFVSILFLALAPAASSASTPPGLRLIETSPEFAKAMVALYPDRIKAVSAAVILAPADLMRQLSQQSHQITGHCGGFMDITSEGPRKLSIKSEEALPGLSTKKDWIAAMLDDVRSANIHDFDLAYTGQFTTRYAASAEGENAAKWLANAWQKMADAAGRDDIKVELVPGPDDYNQSSVRITIMGKKPDAAKIVLGAHLDSINVQGDDAAPGQDDDASGIAALTEVYRIMLARNAHPTRTVQIFGYSAEEVGLLGSRVIAEHYQSKSEKVRAVLQLDMVAWPGDAHAITFITDNVDQDLTLWTEQLYGLYVGGDVREDRCGYACSDHASWHRYGYPSVMPFESPMDQMNSRIHSSHDVWDELLDADYAARFVKLGVAFVAELSN